MKGKERLSLSQNICLSRARTRRVRKALQQDVAKLAFLQVPSAFHFSKPAESEVYFRSGISTLTLFGFTYMSNRFVSIAPHYSTVTDKPSNNIDGDPIPPVDTYRSDPISFTIFNNSKKLPAIVICFTAVTIFPSFT